MGKRMDKSWSIQRRKVHEKLMKALFLEGGRAGIEIERFITDPPPGGIRRSPLKKRGGQGLAQTAAPIRATHSYK